MYLIMNKETREKCTLRFETFHEALVYKEKYYNSDVYKIYEDDSNWKEKGSQAIYDYYTINEV